MTFGKYSQPFFRRGLCLAILLGLVFVTGCSKKDPVKKLLRAGGELEYQNKDRKEKARNVTFPASTDDAALAVLEEPTFSQVSDVNLSGTKITDEGLKHLEKLKSITKLDLNNTQITDAGLDHLKELTNLAILDLGDTAVTDAGLKKLHDHKNLTVLEIKGRPKPTEPSPRGWDTAFRLGIDLRGGTNLVYQVVGTEEKPITTELMNQMIGAVKRRLDPAGTEEITVRKVGSDRIEVIIPKADPAVVIEKKRLMTRLGTLEFALLANRTDHEEEIAAAEKIAGRDLRQDGRLVAGWREVGLLPTGKPKDVGEAYSVVSRPSKTNKDVKEFLVIFGKANDRVTGDHLKNARPSNDENGRPAVSFTFNLAGANRFARLTGNNRPSTEGGFQRRLAILLDDRIHSAPSIITTISTNGQITGAFTMDEVQELTNVLNAGALVLEFKKDDLGQPTPISEQTISPTLGADVQEKGKFAIILAASTVVVFMLGYYLFAGAVADICLVINLILVMGAMAFIDAAFTLPGLAGIVLTIGMAVDANVLIFERIREEMNRGSSLRMSIQNGFARAFTTIVDANLTTLITAVVLYLIGTDQVRGFAVTLFIGIVMSMFSALFVGRLIFDVCERKRWLKTLKMNSVIGATSWDFVSKKSIAAVVSLVVIVAGMGVVVTRGSDLLDIDFTGGTMVTMEFEKGQNTDEIKKIFEQNEILKDGMTLEVLQLASEGESGDSNRRFRLRGKEQSERKFKKAIIESLNKAGAEKYALREVTIEKLSKSMIEPVDGPAKKDQKTDAKKKAPALISEYSGGHKITLTFTDEGVKESTFRDYVSRHLRQLKLAPGEESADPVDSKYSKPQDLFKVRGVTKSSAKQEAGEAAKYQSIELTTKKNIDAADLYAALDSLKTELAASPIFPEINKFDSAVAGDMKQSAILAMVFSLLAIVAYIWFRFKQATFGLAAVAALVHDVLVVLGVVALAPFLGMDDFKLNLPMIAAFLTIVGYSLNDTIVVFDRVREVRGKNPALTNDIVNTSLNQTLSRTILTSLTTFIVVVILFFAGGEGIHGFAFCLVLGVIVGTYSSIYVASPVLLWLMNRPNSASGKASAAAELSRAKAGTAS